MKRSAQEIVELVVFGLIALLLGTGVLWLLGWVFGAVGTVFIWLAGLIWALLRFIVPVALIAALVVLVVRLVRANEQRAVVSPAPMPPANAPGPTAQAEVPPPPAAEAPRAGDEQTDTSDGAPDQASRDGSDDDARRDG